MFPCPKDAADIFCSTSCSILLQLELILGQMVQLTKLFYAIKIQTRRTALTCVNRLISTLGVHPSLDTLPFTMNIVLSPIMHTGHINRSPLNSPMLVHQVTPTTRLHIVRGTPRASARTNHCTVPVRLHQLGERGVNGPLLCLDTIPGSRDHHNKFSFLQPKFMTPTPPHVSCPARFHDLFLACSAILLTIRTETNFHTREEPPFIDYKDSFGT